LVHQLLNVGDPNTASPTNNYYTQINAFNLNNYARTHITFPSDTYAGKGFFNCFLKINIQMATVPPSPSKNRLENYQNIMMY
jgi:hypothetical protein